MDSQEIRVDLVRERGGGQDQCVSTEQQADEQRDAKALFGREQQEAD